MEINAEYLRIIQATKSTPNNCACEKCAAMCSKSPCLGTPSDILRLLKEGHIDKLRATGWALGLFVGLPVISMVQLIQQKDGSCIMFDGTLCRLHHKGIKPTEGVLTRHGNNMPLALHSLPVVVALTWCDPANSEIIAEIAEYMTK